MVITRPPEHPHGLLGYVVEDPGRTERALRLLRWAVPAAVLAIAIVAVVVVAIGTSPIGLLTSAGTATVAGAALRLRRRRNRVVHRSK